MQHKFTAIHLHPDELDAVRQARGDDDAPSTASSSPNTTAAGSRRREDGRIIAMLHLLPFRTELGRCLYLRRSDRRRPPPPGTFDPPDDGGCGHRRVGRRCAI
ncbi:MAG: hypothetical protein ACLS37_14100 [Alistipes sp.]